MAERFTWTAIYHELAIKLLGWRDRQRDLIEFLENLRKQGQTITPLMDKDDEGQRPLLNVMDPFTFFGVFNRGVREDRRLAILKEIKKKFELESPLPSDFCGIPVLNNMRSWFIAYQWERNADDVNRLWHVFKLALAAKPLDDSAFVRAFDDALKVKYTNINLTLGLFWIRPDLFVNLDGTNRAHLNIQFPRKGLTAKFYIDTVRRVLGTGVSLTEISHQAFLNVSTPRAIPAPPASDYWMVGAFWEPSDMTQQFVEEGVWRNGYEDLYLDEVRSMGVGDRIAIKATSTQRYKLPFDAGGKTITKMTIKAIGTTVANRADGRTVEVEWDTAFQPKDWFFYTNQKTVWNLRQDDESARQLIAFAFFGAPQDFDWFLRRREAEAVENTPLSPDAYDVADILASGVFTPEADLRQAIDRLKSKKNLILQGPPGVGKTFIARKLAYALMEARDGERVEMIQFHQSYSYDDFVRGYRPLAGAPGSFGLQDGVFFKFCQRAKSDPERSYVFIIDEINRGNLSQIFGEILMLIEADKRGADFALPLVYQRPDEPRFYIPGNVCLIGLMNLADRSLAMVDYALRRRFSFMTLRPQYGSQQFRDWLSTRHMDGQLIDLIVTRLTALNDAIAKDDLLGENYQVGHSFFCPQGRTLQGWIGIGLTALSRPKSLPFFLNTGSTIGNAQSKPYRIC